MLFVDTGTRVYYSGPGFMNHSAIVNDVEYTRTWSLPVNSCKLQGNTHPVLVNSGCVGVCVCVSAHGNNQVDSARSQLASLLQ